MKAQEIQSLCIDGTDAYLSFLIENNRGIQRVRVVDKQALTPQANPVFKLTLAERLFDPDCISLELKPPTKTYGPEFFRIVEYDGDAKVLIIEVPNPGLVLDTTPADALWVVSDLRFLVRNVKRWFTSNGLQLQLPRGLSTAHTISRTGEEQPTFVSLESCQKESVACSLGNPLTYVWGPPGTGKTKHTLAQAALQLILAKGKIAIFAPTNNALEQAMTAVLKAAQSNEITGDKFLRVGHPSTDFAVKFPEVCEVQGLERQLSTLRRQISVYETVLNHRRGATVLNSAITLRHEIAKLQNLLQERRGIYEELARMRRNPLSRAVHILDGKSRKLNDRLTRLENQINGLLEMIRRIRTESSKLNGMVERIDFTNAEQIEADVLDLEVATRQYLEVNRVLAEEYKHQSNEEILGLISSLEEQLTVLKAQSAEERIKSSSVTGMTLDCFIGRFYDTLLPFDHIFLDEAGYAPLVKALTLCRGGIPLTFIGDHKQLGPVCEIDDENLGAPSGTPAIVWKQSSLFIDEVFLAEDRGNLVRQLFELNESALKSFARTRLNKTFRFGQNLADILSSCVYQGAELISGGNKQHLEIVCLNAVPSGESDLPRQNRAEVDAISLYLRDHVDLDTDKEEAFAVLAPYINQVALLGKHLTVPRRQGRIMTIHKSQGREWDTVIVSIVDGKFNRPWFTDTAMAKSGGLHVMNTAVSRARKRLVIVCDKNHWLKPDARQLVSQLLKALS
jgi:hypothetical protein